MLSPITRVYPVYSFQFWKAYFVQMRPYLLFISGIAGASGIAMASDNDTHWHRIITPFIPFFLGYGFGQTLTDCFQTDTDKLSAPYRPLSKGIISIKSVLGVSICGLLLSGIVLYTSHPFSFILSGFAVFGLATYSYIKRNVWLAGPFYNGWIVALLPVMGFFSTAGIRTNSFPFSLSPYVLLTFFSYASFVLIGYLKDIEADKATNYKTFPVVWGWEKTIWLGDLLAIVTLILFWLLPLSSKYEFLVGLLASAILIYGQARGHFTTNKTEVGALAPILSTVRSFVLFHIAIVLHFQKQWWVYLVVYYMLFELFLSLRPSRYQV